MGTPINTSRWLRSHSDNFLPVALTALLCLTALAGCAATEEQTFPLDYVSGIRAAMQPGTAREAFQAYQRMGADLERQGRFAQAAIAYSNAFTSARALGRLQDALITSQKAVAMAERAREPRHLGPALVRLGQIHMDLNAPQRAIPILERAARESTDAGNPNIEANSYLWLSRAYRSVGNTDLAIEYTQRAVAVLEPAIARARDQGQRYRGRRQEGLWNMERNYSTSLLGLGGHHLALHQAEPARAYFEKALKSGERIEAPPVMAQAQFGLARVALEQRDPQAAIDHLQESLRLSPQPRLAVSTQSLLGRVYHEMGNLPAAESHLRTSVTAIEDVRSQLQSEESREAFVENKMGVYARLIQVLFDQRKMAEAFDMSERARARAFLDLLGNRVSLSKGWSAALIAEEKSLQERIAQLKARQTLHDSEEEGPDETTRPSQSASQGELELAREAYAAFLSRVRAQSREQASLMTVEPLTLSEVQALLGPGTVLLEYFVGEGRTLGWVVSRDKLRVVRLRVGENELARRISGFRQLIASRGRVEELQRAAGDLFQTLVAPAFPAGLPRELLIVPHRALHYLPFHALMPAPGRYLIQDSLVYYLSSASLMQFTREKERTPTAGALAVGNPDLEDPTLNLRYAEREAREVGRFFPEATVLVGKEATKAQTRRYMDSESLIHLATHADLDGDDPLGSALLLRRAGGDTGRLEVQEVFGLDLHASLVILSACDTSLGKLTQGDEVVGLTRAFIYAGTPSVISTLWMVDDRSSYELMQAFYQNLRAGRGKGEALRQAQLATLAKYPHPYYWAAYQLTGEAR
jgi:CHAT domain-containing protein